uniref:hypothetical protein n=1 Tax=Lacticaseibacillus paracasei TaxID=1597 RepID=UPI00214AEC0F
RVRPIKFAINLLQGSKIWRPSSTATKLNKAQKRMLKDKEIYNHFNLENIPISIKTELNKIVHDIDD